MLCEEGSRTFQRVIWGGEGGGQRGRAARNIDDYRYGGIAAEARVETARQRLYETQCLEIIVCYARVIVYYKPYAD